MSSKDFKPILRSLRAQGWSVERTQSNHWKLKGPQKHQLVFCSQTPSDYRSLQNLRTDLRRQGAKL